MSESESEVAVHTFIATYLQSADADEPSLASAIRATIPDVSFTHPRGHERGWNAAKAQFYGQTMGENSLERNAQYHWAIPTDP